jgi:hypothetical protein
MRSSKWKLAIVIEDIEVDKDLKEEVVLVQVENNLEKKKRPRV